MPISAVGDLRIVSSADLGALGAREGQPALFRWTLPDLTPVLVPGLLVAALLALPRNRTRQAWWVWLPIVMATIAALFPPMLPSGAGFAIDSVDALVVGLAALWLLASPVPHRFFTFTRSLLILGGCSAFAFLVGQTGNALGERAVGEGILLEIAVLATAISLTLVGRLRRGRALSGGIVVWTGCSLLAIWLLLAAPFVGIAFVSSGSAAPISEFLEVVLAVAAVNYAAVLPFLVLSLASPFHRERLRALLHEARGASPEPRQSPIETQS